MELLNKYEKQIIEQLIQDDKTLPEISTVLGISKPATSKYLKKLEEQNIIKGSYERNSVGRTIKYGLQPYHVVFSIDPLNKSIIGFKADEPLDTNHIFLGYIQQKEFREEVKDYLEEIKKVDFEDYIIILYGSVSQGIAHRKSDIDLLFIRESWSKKDKDQILEKIAIISNKCNHPVKPLFKSTKEFQNMDESLQNQIKENGIILHEKGNQCSEIRQQLKRYKIITI
ncbi:MAG: ArsR family transcriptional regulator [Candidatus Thermoplasmatota archaeon]|nr:ArsR family transcriptional regulator [Candidatus Thermoplasmatota archaeon]